MSTYTEEDQREEMTEEQENTPVELGADDTVAPDETLEQDPEEQIPGVNRITQIGNGTLEQMMVNAMTFANLTPDEEGARQNILEARDAIIAAEKSGVEVDVGKYRLNGTGNAADVAMMTEMVRGEMEAQMQKENLERQKEEAVKQEEEEKKAQKAAEEENMTAQEIIGSAAFVGAAVAGGAALPGFLQNPAAPNGMGPEALAAATAVGGQALGMMGLGYLAMSQTMTNSALCQDTHHGLSTSGQQRQQQTGLA